ncbi:hypothetical protein O6H91_Y322000 [Diphasiastrum complanatum]|nr:hypothetical protein O6H91_Y322000 [Diphasiastrum complanatum]
MPQLWRLRAALRCGSLISHSAPLSISSSAGRTRGWHSWSHFSSSSSSSSSGGIHLGLRGPILEPTNVVPIWVGFRLDWRWPPASSLQVKQCRTFATKLKKPKIKPYSSYKWRFKLLANGLYKRWRSGKRHNAHSKTPKQRRQLRRPSVAPPALAKVMKKLHVQ